LLKVSKERVGFQARPCFFRFAHRGREEESERENERVTQRRETKADTLKQLRPIGERDQELEKRLDQKELT
jgi:hypothetical protein